MKVFVAGASGALGIRLTRRLLAAGHEVIGLTRSETNAARLRGLGAEPVVADALDRAALLRALAGRHADAVVHELTALKTPPTRHADMAATNELRTAGTANLLAAARALGAARFVTQSMIFVHGYGDFGDQILTEADLLGPPGRGDFARHVPAMRSAERQTFDAEDLVGIALRYGLIYGLGAGTEPLVAMLRRRRLPVPRGGGGVRSWVHVDDAEAATVAAVERGRPGHAYNIVDDEPVSWGDLMGALAAAFGAPRPWELPGWLLRLVVPYAGAIMTNSLRASNAKAKRELLWLPAVPTYRDGIRRMTVSRLKAAERAECAASDATSVGDGLRRTG